MEVETKLHFGTCIVAVKDIEVKDLRSKLVKQLRKQNICDNTIGPLLYLLQGHPIRDYPPNLHNNAEWKAYFESQMTTVWMSFLQGLWYKPWNDAQQ